VHAFGGKGSLKEKFDHFQQLEEWLHNRFESNSRFKVINWVASLGFFGLVRPRLSLV
jgi:hypothetical protein